MPITMTDQVRFHLKTSARNFPARLEAIMQRAGMIQPRPMGLGKKLMIGGAVGAGAAALPLGIGAYNIHEALRFLERLDNNPKLIAAAHASDARFGSLKGLTNAEGAPEATFSPDWMTGENAVTTRISPEETRTSFGNSFLSGGSRFKER